MFMRDNMYENTWSPFDPKWYQEAFDKFVSTADQLFNQDMIIKQGYHIPDADGSKSSVFRNTAVLNNSFNEKALREALKDIYLNSSHRLIASNHDNTHFYQWQGYMSDMTYIPNTNMCQISIPIDTFIGPKERDKYKLSQFYRKWIKVEEILNNWNIFKWHCLLFINEKIYSEYEIRIDDHEVAIRFRYYDYWVKRNYSLYVYKFDTNSQSRILISRYLCVNQWDWKVPVSEIPDQRVANATNVIVAINKISDSSIRKDGIDNIEVLGDNLEFLKIQDGYIDMSHISEFNRQYIKSESTEWLWMSIIVPKFFHEYPILLPTDVIYRPYEPDFQPIITLDHDRVQHLKTTLPSDDKYHQIYIDENGHISEIQNGWKQMIRPVVLSDAFDSSMEEPSKNFQKELRRLRELTVQGADVIESFKNFILNYTIDDITFDDRLNKLVDVIHVIHDEHNKFLDMMFIETDQSYERTFKKFNTVIDTIREDGLNSDWFNSEDGSGKDFWLLISPLIHIPRELSDKYSTIDIIESIDRKILWKDINDLSGRIRFQRPIDEKDFWTFKYDIDNKVWRPYPLSISRHFPDVYTMKDPKEEIPSLNQVFKTFFFYSDTMNVLNESSDIIRATPSWDDDIQEYEFDRGGIYRDIFMEKFYWMGVRSIYKGLMKTKCRWEAIEYVIDNDSYQRFNELFLKTLDPYFKLGLASYLKSDNFEFPFDDAISKMQEAINSKFIDYKKITNFEIYLNKSWIPSYFDHIVKIMDNWDYSNRLIRRPRSTFDITRLLPILIKVQTQISHAVESLNNDIDWILEKLSTEEYNLDVESIGNMKVLSTKMNDNIDTTLSFTKELDLQIYSIDDINHITVMIDNHVSLINEIKNIISDILNDTENHSVYKEKIDLLTQLSTCTDIIPDHISKISSMIQSFDINGFMKSINDLRSYFEHDKHNEDDNSLIGHINKFDDPWSQSVKDARNKLFISTSILFGLYEPQKTYDNNEVIQFTTHITNVKNDILELNKSILRFWDIVGYEYDQEVIDKLTHVDEFIDTLILNINDYINARNELLKDFDFIKSILNSLDNYQISVKEKEFSNVIVDGINNILRSLSYIAGKNNSEDALDAHVSINNHIHLWNKYLDVEQSVFERIFKIVKPPIEFLEALENHQEILDSIMEYMDTTNVEFIPDTSWPTYSDIYEIESVEIVSGGFHNNIGETLFIPNLGTYKIVSVAGNVSKADKIEKIGYRNTVFRDPVVQSNPYDTTTSGEGLGITIKALTSIRKVIINDEIINSIIMQVQNAIYLVSRDAPSINPANNPVFEGTIESLNRIKEKWNDIVTVYREHLSKDAYTKTDSIVMLLMKLVKPSNSIIEIRSDINVEKFLNLFDDLITSYSNFLNIVEDPYDTLKYYDTKCREAYATISDFYGNGLSWSDGNELKVILKNTQQVLRLLSSKLSELADVSDIRDRCISLCNTLVDMGNSMRMGIELTSGYIIDINSVTRSINDKIKNMPNKFQKDIWYKFKNLTIAEEGKNYKVGDIVEIIPELPKDINGNDITDMEDVILNDVILLQITEVDDEGHVFSVRPMMDYAIPYLIWGIRNTITKVGSGNGLVIDAYSYEVQLSDSTLFESPDSDVSKLPVFDENDMFVFKFENIYDLNIVYEVFFGGKQITNFYQRHESVNDPLKPTNIDALYLNANDIMDLKNVSVYIPAEHYFVYRLDNIEIIDPGAGYSVGQDIFVDVDQLALRLRITKLLSDPYKGIADAELGNGKILHKADNPSSDYARVSTDSLNNIDDEFNVGYYDRIPREGILKPSTLSLDPEEYQFISKRFDNVEDGDRNKTFMYPDIDMPLVDEDISNGDPDYHWYQGSRIDNSQHPMEDSKIWNGILQVVPPTDPFIPDAMRVPNSKPIKGEYQTIDRVRIHNSNSADALNGQSVSVDVTSTFDFTLRNASMVKGDKIVPTFAHLPRRTIDWYDAAVGKCVIVECDETNGGHRMLYRLRTFVSSGYFVYELPEYADYKWNTFDINWMSCDFYPDKPSVKAQYPTAPYNTAKTYKSIQHQITDNKHVQKYPIQQEYDSTYIHDLTVDDLSVWNWTTHSWEDLHDESRWKLEVRNDDAHEDWGFKLSFLQEGLYSYDMQLFLNKTSENQIRNSSIKRNAVLKIAAAIADEIDTPAINTSVMTGRHLRIRKLFPYEQKETFVIGKDDSGGPLGYEMDFKIAPYIHFRNEIHLEDVKIYNKSAGRFENILDPKLFEVRFKDPKATTNGMETQTNIIQSIIGNPGQGFVDGNVWAWNQEFGIHVFGDVTADFKTDGHLLTFVPIYCPNPPEQDISLEFQVFQHVTQSNAQVAIIMMEFHTDVVEVYGDGYIHNVHNRMAPLPEEFKVIAQYDLDGPTEYDIIISKSARKWTFVESNWMMSPTFHLDNYNIQQDRVYILTDRGRFPLVNPSTGKPSMHVIQTGSGTDVTFLNLYRRYEHLNICTTPYPIRSVYVQRRIPQHGFIDLEGKINKPLNKKFFEFWVNGRLLYDEVTIITPTKIILHGLRSLKNLEIIEVNRDPNEYFSDIFMHTKFNESGRPELSWDYKTYLDGALEGELEDNYTVEEQEYLLSPVWKQVSQDHPEFKNYPPNVDVEDDVLVRANPDDHIITDELDDPTYQFTIVDAPTLEGKPIVNRTLTFEHFGFIPISESQIIDILNEEWSKEIEEDPYFPEHAVMTDAEWYGMTARLYDEYGILVHTLNESAYKVYDTNLLRININNKLSRIVKNPIVYDLN